MTQMSGPGSMPENPPGTFVPTPPAPPAGAWPMYPPPPPPPKRGGFLQRLVAGLISSVLLASLALNVYLGMTLFMALEGPTEAVLHDGDAANRVSVLKVTGTIDDTSAKWVASALRMLKDNPPKALVLRVESPGGGIGASERIAHELQVFRENTKIPVVASFGDLAASGGYYISAAADHIIAEPTTITGSIGVIAHGFTFKGLIEKVGVKSETTIADGSKSKDVLDPFRDWTDNDRAVLRKFLNDGYTRFVDTVYTGRKAHLSRDKVEALATGEPYTANEALSLKLVDSIGFLDDAVSEASKLAKLPASVKPKVTVVVAPRSIAEVIGLSSHVPAVQQPINGETIRTWLEEASSTRLEYRWVP